MNYSSLREAIPIRSVLESYNLDLPPPGGKYRICCPIHKGDNPNSFLVNEEKDNFFCFVEGTGGSVIDLVMKMENLSLRDATSKLAERLAELPAFDREAAFAAKTISRVAAWQAWHKPPPGIGDEEFPKTRDFPVGFWGFTKETIDHFDLRWVDCDHDDWGWGPFIPLKNEEGILLGYAIRQMYKEPKYMFCKGFPRGGMLYGLHKHEINRIMILVEGQKDVMSLWQKGFKNVAGIMGSDLTVKQATILMKYADTVLLCLDADDVGRKKADKIYNTWRSSFDIKRICLPEGEDPHEASIETLKELLGGATV